MNQDKRAEQPILSILGSVAGILAFFFSVVQSNIDATTDLQRWGLSGAAAAAVWWFFLAAQERVVRDISGAGRKALTIYLTGTIGMFLLLFLLPYFSFGLSPEQVDTMTIVVCGIFLLVSLFWGLRYILVAIGVL